MFKNKSIKSRLLTAALLFITFLFSTVLVNQFSIQQVSDFSSVREPSLVVNGNLPAVAAQTTQPLIPLPITSSTPGLNNSANLITTNPESSKKFVLEQNRVLTLLLVVLIGILLLLFALLSPVVGMFWKPNAQDSLKEKAWFLTESFPKLLEGVSIILIVMVIAVLTLAGVLESQGTVSILSVLVGYVLGRKSTQWERSASARSESLGKLAPPSRKSTSSSGNPSSPISDDLWKG
jgi:hypothetical protein